MYKGIVIQAWSVLAVSVGFEDPQLMTENNTPESREESETLTEEFFTKPDQQRCQSL